jgi:hypothetical protein
MTGLATRLPLLRLPQLHLHPRHRQLHHHQHLPSEKFSSGTLLLALPIAHRPLFPGFYKAVVIRNPAVVSAVKEMVKQVQPYLEA